MTPSNAATFLAAYTEELERAMREHPEDYGTTQRDNTPEARAKFAAHFVPGLASGKSSKDGRAVKATCRRLGIAHTYKAIAAYFATGTEAAS